MNSLIALLGLFAFATADLIAGVYTPTITQQYHAQDELGQYVYGHSGGPSAKEEIRTADGITRGSYSYIDGHGLIQSASYISDPVNGFRVSATNLPVAPSAAIAPAAVAPAPVAVPVPVQIAETPEVLWLSGGALRRGFHRPARAKYKYGDVVANIQDLGGVFTDLTLQNVISAKIAHFAAHNEAIARLVRKRRSLAVAAPLTIVPGNRFAYSSITAHGTPLAYTSIAAHPAPVIAAPLAVPSITKSQFHAQDELGQYTYGYSDGLSAKQESRSADGVTTGGYSYLDSNGIVQHVKYVADAAGFRVAASNIPVGPA